MLAGLGAGIKVFKEIVKKRKEKQRSIQTVDPDYPDNVVEPQVEEEPNNLFWETIELTFIIGGLVVNLAATAIDQKQTVARNDAANAQTAKQLRDTEASLNYLERLGTRFETLSFTVTFRLHEFPNEFLSKLFPDLADMFWNTNTPVSTSIGYPINRDLSRDNVGTMLTSLTKRSIGNDLFGFEFIYKPQVYLNLVAATSPERHLHHSKDFYMSARSYDYIKIVRDFHTIITPILISTNTTYVPIDLMLMDLPTSESVIKPMGYDLPDPKYFYFGENASTKGDLFVLATNCNQTAHFTFIPASKELFVQLDFDCPKTSWEQTAWMESLVDLGKAILFLNVANVPESQRNRIVPVSGKFTFDRTTITVTNFLPCRPRNWHGCELPSKREILDMR